MICSTLSFPFLKKANYLLVSLANSWQKDLFFWPVFPLFVAYSGFRLYSWVFFVCGEREVDKRERLE